MSSKVVFVVLMLSVLLQVSKAILCPPYEQLDDCGKKCEPSCHNPNPECTMKACTSEDSDCRCKKGYYRDYADSCVAEVDCILKK